MSSNKVAAKAMVRIISRDGKKEIKPPESFHVTVSLMPGINYPKEILDHVIKTDIVIKYEDAFTEALKKNTKQRNALNGVRWRADVVSFSYDDVL